MKNKKNFGFFVSNSICDLHLSRRTTNAHSRRLGEMLLPGIIWHESFWKNLRRLLKYITINPERFFSIGYFFPSQKNPRKNRFFEASKAGSPLNLTLKFSKLWRWGGYTNLACQLFFFTITAVHGSLKSSRERERGQVFVCNLHDHYSTLLLIRIT